MIGTPNSTGNALDLFHVGGFHVAGNQVDPVLLVAVGRGEIIHHALDHVGEAGDMRPHVAGGVGMDDVFARGNLAFIPGLGDDLGDVVPDGLRQAGGMNRDDLGLIYGKDVVDGLEQVGLPPEHGGAFGEGTRPRHHRLLVVPGQGAAVIGAAALGAVAVGQATVDAQGGVHGPDGLAGLGRINGQGRAFRDFTGCMSQ